MLQPLQPFQSDPSIVAIVEAIVNFTLDFTPVKSIVVFLFKAYGVCFSRLEWFSKITSLHTE